MTMPCHITGSHARPYPWEGPEFKCDDCGHIFREWRNTPYGPLISDLCEDCYAVQHDNDRPEDIHEW